MCDAGQRQAGRRSRRVLALTAKARRTAVGGQRTPMSGFAGVPRMQGQQRANRHPTCRVRGMRQGAGMRRCAIHHRAGRSREGVIMGMSLKSAVRRLAGVVLVVLAFAETTGWR